MTRPDRIKRDAQILELRAQKLSWRAIGKRVGVTGARAQQIGTGKTGHKAREPKPVTIRSYLRERVREADEHFRTIEAMLKAGLCE